jgi:glycosyltransferase involved in cell wall biosynthesis
MIQGTKIDIHVALSSPIFEDPTMRIIFDISTVAQRFGIPGGVGRVERELAAHALENRPDIQFSFFDRSRGVFTQVGRQWVPTLVRTDAVLDVPRPSSSRAKGRLPWRRLSAALRFEYNLQVALERVRLTSPSPTARSLATNAIALVSRTRAGRKGSKFRPSILPFDVATGDPLELDPDCVLVSVGYRSGYNDLDQVEALKARQGFRLVTLCHDLILVQFPELIGERSSQLVRDYWIRAFPLSDLVVFTSKTVERDVRVFCEMHHVTLGPTSIVGLGWNPRPSAAEGPAELPAAVEPGKYVLMVSSLDARKGHDLIVRVWRRLLAEGIPQSRDFKLVFVGPYGLNTPHLKKMLAGGAVGPTLMHFHGVPDGQLTAFYRDAAFCVFPSRYEGFGLPAVEALGAGKALIASTGGAIPEVVAGLAPCIDPDDEQAWYDAIRKWIVDPDERSRFEEKVRRSFKPRTWQETGESFFSIIDRFASSALSDQTSLLRWSDDRPPPCRTRY